MKNEKTTWVFLCIKYSKFWSILLEHFAERNPLISEEWCLSYSIFGSSPNFSSQHWCSRVSEHSRSQNTHIYLASREKSESCTENCLFYPQQNNKRTPNPLSTTLFTANRYTIHIANALLWFRLQRLRLHSGSYYIKVHHNKYVHIQYKYNNI